MALVLDLLLILTTASTAWSAPSLARRADVPQFVKDYAPLVWLHSQDPYLPSDLNTHISHTTPENNFNAVQGAPSPLDITNLDSLNNLGAESVYLTANDDPSTYPGWLQGNAPDSNGKTPGMTAAVIVNDKGNGVVDAFYMYFYSFNWGGIVRIPIIKIKLGNYGNHVGDWEHNMIRFVNGTPTDVWYSQHASGEVFTYDCLEKQGLRPITYSGNGSHANYAIDGVHDHTVPNLNGDDVGLLTDFTDKGKLWDPLLSAGFYSYSPNPETFTAYDGSSAAWLYFRGKWGDQQYPKSDHRQKDLFGNAKWANGPTGPRDKTLDRKNVCPSDTCIVRPFLTPRVMPRDIDFE